MILRVLRGLVGPALVVGALAVSAFGCAPRESSASTYGERANDWTIPGVLRVEAVGGPDNLDPMIGQYSIDTDISMFWAAHLFNWSDAGELVPELATVVPTPRNGGISRDGRTITYHLRTGVRWQDGAPFDARDIVFSWRAVMNPRNDVAVRAGYDLIRGIDVPDPHTVIVHLAHPYAPFVTTFFSMSDTAYAILPQHLLAGSRDLNHAPYNRMPIGTGPFRITRADDTHLRLTANPDYWRGAPKLRDVEFRFAQHSADVIADLRHHNVDLYLGANEHYEPQLHGIPGTTVYLYPFSGYEDVGFNMASPIVSDRRVRQALAYATDRTGLLDRIGNGVDASADTDQAPLSWAHDDQVRHYEYDPREARALLDAAGWVVGPDGIRRREGRRLTITLVGDGDPKKPGPTQRSLAASWRAIGIETIVRNYDDAKLDASAEQGGILATGRFDAILEAWVKGVDPDDSNQLMCGMQPPNGWNVYGYCSARVDAAERMALSSYDRGTRRAAYAQIQATVAEDLPFMVLYFQQQQDVVNLDLKNYHPASAVTPFWNTWELEM